MNYKTVVGGLSAVLLGITGCGPSEQEEEQILGCQTDADCKNGRICQDNVCEEEYVPPENCTSRAERVCFDRFIYYADSCGILDDDPVDSCRINENCRNGYCEAGEVIFEDDFHYILDEELWHLKGSVEASVEDGYLTMSSGSIESRELLDYHLLTENDSLVIEFLMSLDSDWFTFGSSGICRIYQTGEVSCPSLPDGPRFDVVDNPSRLHFYQIRLDSNPEDSGEMDIRFFVDYQEVINATFIDWIARNLVLLWCGWGEGDTFCNFDFVRVLRVDP